MAEVKKADTAKQEQKEEKTPSQPAAAATEKKTPEKKAPEKKPTEQKPTEKKTPEKVAGLRVVAGKDGFRRAGREWHGTTDVHRDEFTEQQVKQLLDEPRLAVQEIEIEG